MPKTTELSEKEIDSIISALKEEEAGDGDGPMTVVGASAVKHPTTVKVIDQESLPIDKVTARKMKREAAKKKDPLIQVIKGNPAQAESLDIVIEELADEIFSLKFERERLESEEKNIAEVSGKRVTAIKALIDTYLKKRELNAHQKLDFRSDQMQIVMKLIFAKIQDSLKAMGYPKEGVQTFFQVFQKHMENFEVEAQRAIDQNR
jgi:hypothetical protein